MYCLHTITLFVFNVFDFFFHNLFFRMKFLNWIISSSSSSSSLKWVLLLHNYSLYLKATLFFYSYFAADCSLFRWTETWPNMGSSFHQIQTFKIKTNRQCLFFIRCFCSIFVLFSLSVTITKKSFIVSKWTKVENYENAMQEEEEERNQRFFSPLNHV